MNVKILGVFMILAGSAGVGFALAANDRRQEQLMEELQRCLKWMSWELAYRMPPLPILCRVTAKQCSGAVGQVLEQLSNALEQQLLPDPADCMNAAIDASGLLPKQVANHLRNVGATLGQFDLQQQLAGLEATEIRCRMELEEMRSGKEVRIRNYQTLSICAGAGLVIILL